MATSLLQKIRLAWRGWRRRSAEAAKQRNAEFLARSTSWAPPVTTRNPEARPKDAPRQTIDREGLQVAYLDDSGAIEHYLDVETGEVIEFSVATPLCDVTQNPSRFRRIPTRTPESEQEDRRAFVDALDGGKMRERLAAAIASATEFRQVLSSDRTIERAWYNFKNDRANAAIERWLNTTVSS